MSEPAQSEWFSPAEREEFMAITREICGIFGRPAELRIKFLSGTVKRIQMPAVSPMYPAVPLYESHQGKRHVTRNQ